MFDSIKDWYVKNFQKCKKCGSPIDPTEGYWHWDDMYPQIGGYYHSDCGINSEKPKGFFPI